MNILRVLFGEFFSVLFWSKKIASTLRIMIFNGNNIPTFFQGTFDEFCWAFVNQLK